MSVETPQDGEFVCNDVCRGIGWVDGCRDDNGTQSRQGVRVMKYFEHSFMRALNDSTRLDGTPNIQKGRHPVSLKTEV